jgi:hypothetical protein
MDIMKVLSQFVEIAIIHAELAKDHHNTTVQPVIQILKNLACNVYQVKLQIEYKI